MRIEGIGVLRWRRRRFFLIEVVSKGFLEEVVLIGVGVRYGIIGLEVVVG